MTFRYPKVVPRWPQDGSSGIKMTTRPPKNTQNGFPRPRTSCSRLGGVRILVTSPFLSLRTPKMTHDGPMDAQFGPNWPQGGPQMAQEGSKRAPRGPQERQRRPQDGPKTVPRRLQAASRGPKNAQEGPKRTTTRRKTTKRQDRERKEKRSKAKNRYYAVALSHSPATLKHNG